jgi:hypothetical protein
MFGFGRSKKVDKIYSVLQPLVAVQMTFKGIPPGFWTNPFVLGYFSFFARYLLQELFGGQPKPEEVGHIISSVLQRLSNINGAALIRNINDYNDQGNPDFEHGCDMAAVLAFYMHGKMNSETKPYIDRALEAVTPIGGKPDTSIMSTTLFRMTFQDEIAQRFLR